MKPLVRRKLGACVLNMRPGITDASFKLRVPATATKLSESPSGKSQAAMGDTPTERLAELSGDGPTCAPCGAAGNSCFARSTGDCTATCATGEKNRADAVTKRWKQGIAAERMRSSNDLGGSSPELEPES